MKNNKFSKHDIMVAIEHIKEFLKSKQGFERSVLGWIRDEYQKSPENKDLVVGVLLKEISLSEDRAEDYLSFWVFEILNIFQSDNSHLKKVSYEGYDEPIDISVAVWDELVDFSTNKKYWKELELIISCPTDEWDLEVEYSESGQIIYPDNPISQWTYDQVSSRLLDLDYDHN